jgi:hypothetical protein
VVRNRQPSLYVWVEYTAEDALGKASISYRYPKGRLIPLANGEVLPVEELKPGMQFLLEPGGFATVGTVSTPQLWNPDGEFRDGYGNAFRRVIGTFRFEGWVAIMTVTVGGEVHRVTPGHPYWSETRRGWYPIGTFAVGELVLTPEKVPLPIQALTHPQWVRETVYNVEVEEFHTYFVGKGLTAVWAHNGQGPLNCGVPQAARAESGKLESGSKVAMGGDRKFAVGWDAIFGPKDVHVPSGSMAGKKIGHTFTKHGSHNTHELAMEARNSGRPVGQWTNDAAAEAFIGSKLPELTQGAKTVDLPPGIGRMLTPDGGFIPANKARLVPSGSGVKTSFPFFE